MERYIYGTAENGAYTKLGVSNGLNSFFYDSGASSVDRTIDYSLALIKTSILSSNTDASVSFRYAPMHLYRKPDMPSRMKEFCLIGTTGLEFRATRESRFVDLVFFPFESVVHTSSNQEGLSYTLIDCIFGTKFFSWKDVENLRKGSINSFELNPVTDKIAVKIWERDRPAVIAAVRALFDKKYVVISPEAGRPFQQRARDLLVQIYSLLPPRFAVETGCAVNLSENEIPDLLRETNIRLFVVPKNQLPREFGSKNCLILDMDAKQPVLSNDIENKILLRLAKTDWQDRQQFLDELFADTIETYADQGLFYSRCKEFLSNPLMKWLFTSQKKESFSTLEQLRDKYTSDSICERLPWARTQFVKAVPYLLKKPLSIEQLTIQALCDACEADLKGDQSTRDEKKALFEFGNTLCSGKLDAVYQPLVQTVSVVMNKKTEDAVNAEKTQANQALQTLCEKMQTDLQEERKSWKEAIDNANRLLDDAKQEAENRVTYERKRSKMALDAEREEKERLLNEEKQRLKQTKVEYAKEIAERDKAMVIALDKEREASDLRVKTVEDAFNNALVEAQRENDRLLNEIITTLERTKSEYSKTLGQKQAEIQAKEQALDDEKAASAAALEAAKQETERQLNKEKENLEQIKTAHAEELGKKQEEINAADKRFEDATKEWNKSLEIKRNELLAKQREVDNAKSEKEKLQHELESTKKKLKNQKKKLLDSQQKMNRAKNPKTKQEKKQAANEEFGHGESGTTSRISSKTLVLMCSCVVCGAILGGTIVASMHRSTTEVELSPDSGEEIQTIFPTETPLPTPYSTPTLIPTNAMEETSHELSPQITLKPRMERHEIPFWWVDIGDPAFDHFEQTGQIVQTD